MSSSWVIEKSFEINEREIIYDELRLRNVLVLFSLLNLKGNLCKDDLCS